MAKGIDSHGAKVAADRPKWVVQIIAVSWKRMVATEAK